MSISSFFPSQYLKAGDFANGERTLTIEAIQAEEVGREKERKPVLYFAGEARGLILNKTNASLVAAKYGDDETQWAGKLLTLYADQTAFGGTVVDCIRVRVPIRPAPAAPLQQAAPSAPAVPTAATADCPF